MSEIIKVGMADLKICASPDGITTLGLGSCVGVVLYDPAMKLCGMVHVMLPDSTTVRNNSNTAKFADSGIKELLKRLEAKGTNRSRLKAKIAGGAQMFAFNTESEMMRIGDRNVEACKKVLKELQIPIVAEDTGLNYGRTVTFYPETSAYEIKAVGKPLKVI